MRLVVDTNVFVSAALKESSWPGHTIRLIGRYGGLLKSTATEQELLDVLQRPRFAPKIAPVFLDGVRRMPAAGELITITEHLTLCRDPADNKFLELAVNLPAHPQAHRSAGSSPGNGRLQPDRTTPGYQG